MKFSQDLLSFFRQEFLYEPDTGLFRWRRSGHSHGGRFNIGDIAGTKNPDRVMLHSDGIGIRAHTLAHWFMTGEGVPTGLVIDHIDRNPNNNRWSNLRVVTRAFNNRNKDVLGTNKSGCAGVHPAKVGRWFARINTVEGKILNLGTYETLEDAIRARLLGEMKYIGEITSTHMLHLYDPEHVPTPRVAGQWRDEERRKGWRTRKGITVPVIAAELKKYNVTD